MSKIAEILKSGQAPGFRLGAPDPNSADVAAPRGLREMERMMGTSRLERELGMPAKKLKKIWNIN